MLAVLGSIGTWAAGRLAAWGLGRLTSLAFIGPLAPIITAIAKAIGATITAVFEIIVALSKSPEGRVVLAIAALGIGFLVMRHHYIEEGKAWATAHPKIITKVVTKEVPVPAKCQARKRRWRG